MSSPASSAPTASDDSSFHVFIEYQNGEKKSRLDIDVNESLEFFRYQIYSLTSISPQQQNIVGFTSGSITNVKEETLLKQLGVTNGQRLIVTQKLSEDVAASKPVATTAPAATPSRPAAAATAQPSSAASYHNGPIDLQSCCTRSFFGTDLITQPGAFLGDRSICISCVNTCVPDPRQLKPRLTMKAFKCECMEVGGGQECLFGERSRNVSDRLSPAVANQAKDALKLAMQRGLDSHLAQGQQRMQAQIGSHMRAVLEYENQEWQDAARATVPLASLQQKAQQAISSGTSTLSAPDELMNQLLHWFKHDFFKWVNQPDCDTCGKPTQGIGAAGPTPEEAQYRPGVVELYRCQSGHTTRFPRYNHALKLLQTKKGRCGEFAQAFTLICRAVGYEARSVNDWTDHVWTEYYSIPLQRWIHADSCESRRDAPLLYEGGWGKKLNYIIACSKDEVVDVTQRYTRKWEEVTERRLACPEEWLQRYLVTMSQIKLSLLSPARQSELLQRRTREQAEFAAALAEGEAAEREKARKERGETAPASSSSAVEVKDEEKQGRTTGSVEWRASRGELGASEEAVARALGTMALATPSTSSSTSTASTAPVCVSTEKEKCSTDPGGAMAASSSSSSTPAAAAAPLSTADKLTAARARAALLFRLYTQQLTVGCTKKDGTCTTSQCKSNSSFTPPADPKEIGKLALEMTKTGERSMCQDLEKK